MELSVIIPFKNEEGNLEKLDKELRDVLERLKVRSEVIYVDDGSSDASYELIKKTVKKNKSGYITYKIISLRKNFGQTAAIAAGIDNSKGKYISFLDADLQNDPADIPRFMEKIGQGYDAVFGWRKKRRDASVRSYLSVIANSLINKLFAYPYHDVGCSARVVKREFVTDLGLFGELHRVMPVLIYLKGAKITEIVVSHRQRKKGKSKYGFERIVKTILDLMTVKFLTSYGTKPAYIFGSAGLASIGISGLTLVAVAYRKLFQGVFVHRDPLFLIAIFFGLLGVQFMLMGLLAELQVRTYFGSQGKSIYDIRSIEEFD